MKRKKQKLGGFEFTCEKCKKAQKKDVYCIAQQAMGHTMIFTCSCGHKQRVP